jgi:hypothetical protein
MNNDSLASALRETLISPNEGDRNGESANVVDGLFAISRALDRVADKLGFLGDVAEAVLVEHRRMADGMGHLDSVADAIKNLAGRSQ